MKNVKLGLVVSVAIALTACGGGGGGGSSSTASAPVAQAPVSTTPAPVQTPVTPPVPKVTPIKVQATSYLNYKTINRAPSVLPTFTQPLPYTLVAEGNARAFADFEQNGTLSYFEMSLDYDLNYPSQKGSIKFWHDNGNGTFVDVTSKLIPNAANQVGCLHPRKAIVADFNNDGKPDIFVACHGYDGTLPGAPAGSPPPGEMPMLLLSQPDGTYKVSIVPLKNPAFMHSATAADLNGDGYPDIVVVDDLQNSTPYASPVFVLQNNGDGTFTENHTNLSSLAGKAVWSVEILDVKGDGNFELWVAGEDANSIQGGGSVQSAAYQLQGNFQIANSPMITFPSNQQYPTPLDITVANGYAYFDRTDSMYDGYVIEKVDLSTCNSTTCMTGVPIFTSTVNFSNSTNPVCAGIGGQWIDFFRILNGKIVTDDSCQSPNVAG